MLNGCIHFAAALMQKFAHSNSIKERAHKIHPHAVHMYKYTCCADECARTWRRALQWLLHLDAVGPLICELGAGRHDTAVLVCAEFGDGSVQHIRLVEEVDH